MPEPKSLHYQTESYQDGGAWFGQVVEINPNTNKFRVVYTADRPYNDEETPHVICRRWAEKQGYGIIPRATN